MTDNIMTDNILDNIIPPFYNTTFNNNENKIFFLNLFGITSEQSKEILENMRNNSLKILKEIPDKTMNKLTHKIWLTTDDNGYMPTEHMINLLRKNYTELKDFKHYLWCNNNIIGNKIITDLCITDLDIQLRNPVEEFKNYIGYKIFNIFLNHKLFANACDILRIQVVNKYGGLYSDFGWLMTKYISEYLNNFDIMFNGENAPWCKGVISHNIIYSNKVNHIIFTKMLYYLENKEFLNTFNSELKLCKMIEIVGPIFLMAIIPALCKNDKLILLTHDKYTFDNYHTSSHITGLFGSSIINNKIDDIHTELLEYIKNI